ncbi:hypothetical protein CIW83_03085 [Tissierella sp. P1]|uniref:hypothetical protein n=1 Tax=Tissierella sp. P1 TaxID=1280483 RepID=UPI000BA00990|nr:hypothetical protein [Tissierella sp. P1]OZV13545.1 hypothetical protein CIW83_03085 [Tissierella sp. P1]
MIKVYTKNHQRYENGYHTILHLEREDYRLFDNYRTPDNEVWIVWKPHFTIHSNNDIDNISENKNWTPRVAFKWLTKELIPKVIYENTVPSNFLGKPRITYSEFLKNFDINHYIYTDFAYIINIQDILNKSDLLESIEHMQSFFSVYEDIFLKKEDINNIYIALLKILKNCENVNLGYITGNLGFTRANSYDKLIEDIKKYVNEIKDSVVGSFTVDTTLRCIVVSLRDFKCSLSTNQIQDICYLLEPLIEVYNRETLLKKNTSY